MKRAGAQESNRARNTDPGLPQEAEQQHTPHQSGANSSAQCQAVVGTQDCTDACSEPDQGQPQAGQGVPMGPAKVLNSAVNFCPLEQPGTGRAHTPQCKLPCDTGTCSQTSLKAQNIISLKDSMVEGIILTFTPGNCRAVTSCHHRTFF